jgi:hypothetical protein
MQSHDKAGAVQLKFAESATFDPWQFSHNILIFLVVKI